jgi:hypothetical protein
MLKSPQTREFFAKYMTAFAHWIETIKGGSKRTQFDRTAAA